MINITREELEKMPILSASMHNNGGTLYIKDDQTLYKIFHNRYYFIEEKERNVDFLINAQLTCPKAIDKIYINGEFYGYSEPYIKNAKSFLASLSNRVLSPESKSKIIGDIFAQLREIHKLDVFLGDIHLDNFIYDDNMDGYIIDLDDIRFKGIDDFKFTEFYCLRNNDHTPMQKVANAKSDVMKTLICALSFFYGINFEQMVKEKGVDQWFLTLQAINVDEDFIKMLKAMWYEDKELVYLSKYPMQEVLRI